MAPSNLFPVMHNPYTRFTTRKLTLNDAHPMMLSHTKQRMPNVPKRLPAREFENRPRRQTFPIQFATPNKPAKHGGALVGDQTQSARQVTGAAYDDVCVCLCVRLYT